MIKEWWRRFLIFWFRSRIAGLESSCEYIQGNIYLDMDLMERHELDIKKFKQKLNELTGAAIY